MKYLIDIPDGTTLQLEPFMNWIPVSEELPKEDGDVIYRQDAIDAIIKQKVIDKSVAHRIILQLPSVGTYNDIYKQGWNDGRAELQKEMWEYEQESDE